MSFLKFIEYRVKKDEETASRRSIFEYWRGKIQDFCDNKSDKGEIQSDIYNCIMKDIFLCFNREELRKNIKKGAPYQNLYQGGNIEIYKIINKINNYMFKPQEVRENDINAQVEQIRRDEALAREIQSGGVHGMQEEGAERFDDVRQQQIMRGREIVHRLMQNGGTVYRPQEREQIQRTFEQRLTEQSRLLYGSIRECIDRRAPIDGSLRSGVQQLSQRVEELEAQ